MPDDMTEWEREQLNRIIRILDGSNGRDGLRSRQNELWDEVFGAGHAGREGLVQWKQKIEVKLLWLTGALAGGVTILSLVGALLQSLGAARTVRILEAITAIQGQLP